MLAEADAALVIGDPALYFDERRGRGSTWARSGRARTGLPFVYAFWAGPAGRASTAADVRAPAGGAAAGLARAAPRSRRRTMATARAARR